MFRTFTHTKRKKENICLAGVDKGSEGWAVFFIEHCTRDAVLNVTWCWTDMQWSKRFRSCRNVIILSTAYDDSRQRDLFCTRYSLVKLKKKYIDKKLIDVKVSVWKIVEHNSKLRCIGWPLFCVFADVSMIIIRESNVRKDVLIHVSNSL